MLFIDFETRSAVDLVKRGIYNYAPDPSTDILCMSWCFDQCPVQLWYPRHEIAPEEVIHALRNDEMIAAWNAQFERLIWNHVGKKYGLPPLPIEKFLCIAALARARGFPGKLEKAARFANAHFQKDMDGHRLMMRMCKPRDDGAWNEDPDDLERLGEYCIRDSEVERALYYSFLPFSEHELAVYHRTEKLNDRGICYDAALAEKVVEEVTKEKLEASDEISALTGGAVQTPNQVAAIRAWLETQDYPLPDLNKGTITDVLDDPDMPDVVREVLELRQEQAKAAVSKFEAMCNRGHDGLIQGLFMFRGAGQTGRYSSNGVQIHNLVRKASPEALPIFMKRGVPGLRMIGSPVHLLSQMVRPAFVASEDKVFLVGDFAQIEARITAWLAGEEWLLEAFRTPGRDAYCEFGSDAFGRTIAKTDEMERTASKHCVLGLGFGGAEGALHRSLKSQANLVLPPETETHLVQTYRNKCKKIKKYWYLLQDAVLAAMYSPNEIIEIQGNIAFVFDGTHLWCKLPSGRLMCYPYAEIVEGQYSEVVRYRRGNRVPKAGVSEWPTVDLWYGILMENMAQAIALDLLDNALEKVEGNGRVTVRGHVHDEVIGEVYADIAAKELPLFLARMENIPTWAEGLPVKAEGHITKRYVKG